MLTETTKRCFKCGETKPLSLFYKHPEMADGHVNKCKECNKKDVRENLQANFEHYQEYEKVRAAKKLPHRVEYKVKWDKTRDTEFPNKKKAVSAVGNAVKRGALIKPCNCEVCGSEKFIQAHHSSYSEDMMLMVTWLCSRCHVRLHADFRHNLGSWGTQHPLEQP